MENINMLLNDLCTHKKILGIFLCCFVNTLAFAVTSEEKAIHLEWRDLKYTPGQDFYAYANGNWIKNNPIPSDHASWSTFSVLQEQNLKNLHTLMQDAASDSTAKNGSIEKKVGDFYTSGMDQAQRDRQGIKPLATELKRIDAIISLQDLPAELARLHLFGINAFFCFVIMQDFKDSTKQIGAVLQAGLTLPDRDYYLLNNRRFTHIRTELVNHMQNMFKLLGESNDLASSDAQTVMRIETALAKASMSQIAQRNPNAIYHMTPINKLSNQTFSWPKYLHALGVKKLPTNINVAMPDYINALQKLLPELSIADIKTYLRWHLISDTAAYLSEPFVNEDFHMTTVLSGVTQQAPAWKKVVNTENQALGFAVGDLYVKRYFSEQAKLEVMEIIHEIHQVLKKDLSTLAWMTPETRLAAVKKLERMEERVGYPEHSWSYDSLIINRGAYVMNVLRANKFIVQHNLHKIDKPIDRSEWEMTPQTINAYYDPSMNSINLPCGILQAPFFDKNASDAVNYGGIGWVIGHEITHGFDDQGAQFDLSGNLNNWWTAADLKTFKEATQCVSQQYSTYTINGKIKVKGPWVVGEATADLGGLTLAYRAFENAQKHSPGKNIDGLTAEQQFFLSAAHTWASSMRPEYAAQLITTDPHPPAIFRVNGSIANLPAFKKAFNLQESSPMVKSILCKIW